MVILETINKYKEAVYSWTREQARGPHARWWLTGVSFSEASFFLIPPDVLLVGILLSSVQRPRWKYWASVTTLSSVVGGIFGYIIGVGLFDLVGQPIVDFYNLQSEVQTVGLWFNQNAFWAVFISAFTPIPFKVFTISAGLFRIHLGMFVIASLLGRGIRFFGIAYIMKLYGREMLRVIMRYFNIISLIIIAIIVALLLI